MSFIPMLADQFRRLPPKWRAGIYLVFGAVGLVLAILQQQDVPSVYGISTDDALAYYTLLTPVFGTYAAVNTRPRRHPEDELTDADEGERDLSSFEPVGDPDAVYA